MPFTQIFPTYKYFMKKRVKVFTSNILFDKIPITNSYEEEIMYHFIINPASRSGQGAKYWNKIEPYLKEHNIAYTAHISSYGGHVAKLMHELTKDLTETSQQITVIVLGGDGTVNEALQGVACFDKLVMGYIPTGSSNDLARDLGISKDPIEALKRILNNPVIHPMDIGTIEYQDTLSDSGTWLMRRFAVSCSLGYDAAICEEVMRSRLKYVLNRIGLGKLVYLMIALKQLISAKSIDARLTIHDTAQVIPIRRLLFLAGMNHRYEGGGFMFAPHASDHDGLIDICCASNATKLKVLRILPTAYKGEHLRFKELSDYHITSYSVQTDSPMWLHADGESLVMTEHIKVSCQKEILHFII